MAERQQTTRTLAELREIWSERAAIREFDGNAPRHLAEQRAWEDLERDCTAAEWELIQAARRRK